MAQVDQHLEFIKTYLPKYLTPNQQDNLFKDVLKDFPHSKEASPVYIRLKDQPNFFQGDGIIDVPFSVLNKDSGTFECNYFSGSILTNTCDILPTNIRLEKSLVSFCAIFPLAQYISILKKRNFENNSIESFIDTLKENRISNLFYLPELKFKNKITLQESFIRFDFITTLPSDLIHSDKYNKEYSPIGDRLFTFSNYGFYLFLLKLSIHFCRFREGVFRNLL